VPLTQRGKREPGAGAPGAARFDRLPARGRGRPLQPGPSGPAGVRAASVAAAVVAPPDPALTVDAVPISLTDWKRARIVPASIERVMTSSGRTPLLQTSAEAKVPF